MKITTGESTHQNHARSLLADIEGAPATLLPRRATIVEWLNTYLARASENGYVTNDAEAGDLIALGKFLRTYEVPATHASAA